MVGAAPSFSEVHLVRTLLLLENSQLGRKKLVQLLEVGEGSTRTILKRLKKEKLVSSSKQGHSLTAKGQRKIQTYLKKFSRPRKIKAKIVEGKKIAVVVHKAINKINKGLEERDLAVKVGAQGVLLFKYRNKISPTVSDFKLNDFPDLLVEIKKFNLQRGDVLVISFGDTLASAENGAIAIALHLTQK